MTTEGGQGTSDKQMADTGETLWFLTKLAVIGIIIGALI